MSEFEYYQALMLLAETLSWYSTNIIAVIFAYTVAFHFVGKDLSSPIAVSVTFLYSYFVAAQIAGHVGNVFEMYRIGDLYFEAYPDGKLFNMESVSREIAVPIMVLLPNLLAWLGSILYAHFVVRRETNEKSNS